MLDPQLSAQVRTYFATITRPVELRAATDHSTTSTRMSDLLSDLAGLSDSVTVVPEDPTVAEGVRRPSFEVTNPGTHVGIRFCGVPMGHEFTSLVLAILQVGGHPSTEDADLQRRAAGLKGPLDFETFFSLSCQNCPTVVQALDLMAVLNPGVTHTAIEGSAFQHEAEARAVRSVPTVFLNGKPFGVGRMTLEKILSLVEPDEKAEPVSTHVARDHDVLVIGGGPAGPTAAIYTVRKGLTTALVAERMGGQVLDTAGIENLPSQIHVEGSDYGARLEAHVRHYDVDVVPDHSVTSLDAPGADGYVGVHLDDGSLLRGRSVIIATGAHWRHLGVPGEEEYRNKGVTYCPHCDGPLFKGRDVAVVGGGNSGIEAAIDLAGVCSHVHVVEFDTMLRADSVLLESLKALSNVTVHLDAASEEILGDGKEVTGLRFHDRQSHEVTTLAVSGVFVQIGLIPNTAWLKGTLDLDARGQIVIDESAHTSVPGVFAAGDCTVSRDKQIIVAAGEGASAGLSVFADQRLHARVA